MVPLGRYRSGFLSINLVTWSGDLVTWKRALWQVRPVGVARWAWPGALFNKSAFQSCRLTCFCLRPLTPPDDVTRTVLRGRGPWALVASSPADSSTMLDVCVCCAPYWTLVESAITHNRF